MEGAYKFFGLHLKERMIDYTMLMIIFAAYGRFLMLQYHDQQGFLQGIFEMQMLLGQQ